MAEHILKTEARERTSVERYCVHSCSCGLTTEDAALMDAHLHWELAVRYRDALLDVYALVPPDRVHLIRPPAQEMVGRALDARRQDGPEDSDIEEGSEFDCPVLPAGANHG